MPENGISRYGVEFVDESVRKSEAPNAVQDNFLSFFDKNIWRFSGKYFTLQCKLQWLHCVPVSGGVLDVGSVRCDASHWDSGDSCR